MPNKFKIKLALLFALIITLAPSLHANFDKGNATTVNNTHVVLRPPPSPVLYFSYDESGNQTQRFFCLAGGTCIIPDPTSRSAPVKDTLSKEALSAREPIPIIDKLAETFSNTGLAIYPNPTSEKIFVSINTASNLKLVGSIGIYNTTGALVRQVFLDAECQHQEVDLSNYASGLYYIHLHFNDNTSTTKTIIKK